MIQKLDSVHQICHLLKKLTTKHSLGRIFQINEIEKRPIACSICKAENNEIVCQLCDSSKKIPIQRECRHEGQIIAVEKMIKETKKRTDGFEVIQCVVFDVPKVDRGPTDPLKR
ncbi:Hypothetical protein CINCED_3A003916 [Cinara cedri]|uniref:Uncharacterized protein n=1 Tax=Cinara cedri TaxID=506608 RepID=A0A5E4NFD5_9HEMI|nr:Hypothetical protein CINCED_3A003916 [Cinara cedri]